MRRKAEPAPPEDKRLRDVLWCVREGFRKLVPCKWGAPPFTQYGAMNSDHDEYYQPDAQPFLVVSLNVWYSAPAKKWVTSISIQDGDDFIFQRFRDFTWEDWCAQMDVYNQISAFDGDMYVLLRDEGFS